MVATISTEATATDANAFFARNAFYVEERRGGVKARNVFRLWDSDGRSVGTLTQRISMISLFLRIFLRASILPYHFEIADQQGRVIAVIRRGSTILVSRIEVLNGAGAVIGYLKMKHRSRKPRVKVFNAEGRKIGEINGSQINWDMAIIDRDYHAFGSITEFDAKTTPGETVGKDTYYVELSREALEGIDRQVMLASAIAVDRVILEN